MCTFRKFETETGPDAWVLDAGAQRKNFDIDRTEPM